MTWPGIGLIVDLCTLDSTTYGGRTPKPYAAHSQGTLQKELI